MYPNLENTNTEATMRIKSIASFDQDFLLGQTIRLAEAIKYNLPAMSTEEIEQLISDFRHASFPPLASVALDELATELAKHITDEELATNIAEFTTIEAFLLVAALELYFADERRNPGRPVTVEAYAPFFPIKGIDQI
jgi:hypothetical protein